MFTYPFSYSPDNEIVEESLRIIKFLEENNTISEGKMLGVLICEDQQGRHVTLKGFSGLVAGRSDIDGFVPPIFDTTKVPALWGGHRNAGDLDLADQRQHPQFSPKTDLTQLQFSPKTDLTQPQFSQKPDHNQPQPSINKEASRDLQDWLFSRYIVHNALGESHSIKEIFAEQGLVPPGGTGECAAPKLLEYAYRNHLKPLKMGEFWFGPSPESGEIREQGRFYPSCIGKCGPLLSWMMRGLEVEPNPLQVHIPEGEIRILHEDEAILAAHKPSGMLCVPGKTGEKSLKEILEQTHGELKEIHRLDMDTSGVVLFAKTAEAQAEIRRQFEARETSKTYIAHLVPGISQGTGNNGDTGNSQGTGNGDSRGTGNTVSSNPAPKRWTEGFKGTIALPIGPDWYDRPRQMIDREHGKQAITRFEILKVFPDGSMDVRFFPLTGRTHQLRVHAAAPEGLAHPIEGDRLYGAPSKKRLMLHAESLTITHPQTGERITFED